MQTLKGKVVVVAGSSRGAGRGIALALGDAGASVYVAARTSRNGPQPADGAPGTVEATAAEVTGRGGAGIPVAADLSDEAQVAALFKRVQEEQGRLDLLANSVWGADFMPEWSRKFWDLSSGLFRGTLHTLASSWWTSVYAARLMVPQKRGLIVHVTDNDYDHPSAYRGQILHDLGHEALNRLIAAMSSDAKPLNIAVVGLNPGFMRTERVLRQMTTTALKKQFRFDLSESTEYIGRAVAALAADAKVLEKSGRLLWVADLAVEYGFTDTGGRRIPRFDPHAPEREFPD